MDTWNSLGSQDTVMGVCKSIIVSSLYKVHCRKSSACYQWSNRSSSTKWRDDELGSTYEFGAITATYAASENWAFPAIQISSLGHQA
jgi:hypothetical protein